MHSISHSPKRPTHHSRCLWTPSTVEARYAPCSSSSNTAASVRLLPCVGLGGGGDERRVESRSQKAARGRPDRNRRVPIEGGGAAGWLLGPAWVISKLTHTHVAQTHNTHSTRMHTYPRCARSECGAACRRAPWWLSVNKLSKAQHDAARPSLLLPGAWCLMRVRANGVIGWVSPFLRGFV